MADVLKMDPARIERLRDPKRLELVDPEATLTVVEPVGGGPIVDVGAGVGFVSLPFARRFGARTVIAVDVLAGMLDLLAETAAEEGLSNLRTALMETPTDLPLPQGEAAFMIMLQVHHELDDASGLLAACLDALAPGAPLVIVDWKAEDLPGMPKGGRRVPAEQIADDLRAAGFADVQGHDLYAVHSTTVGRRPTG